MKSVNKEKGSSAIIFVERIRSLRGPLNQRAFAQKLGMAQQSYARYELGRVPKPDVLDSIAASCGVTVGWLLGSEFGGPERDKVEDLTLRHAAMFPKNAARLLADLVIEAEDASGEERTKLLNQAVTLLKILQHNMLAKNPPASTNDRDASSVEKLKVAEDSPEFKVKPKPKT